MWLVDLDLDTLLLTRPALFVILTINDNERKGIMMDKNGKLTEISVRVIMAVFLAIVIINAITHSLPHELVECASMWLIFGTPVLILTNPNR